MESKNKGGLAALVAAATAAVATGCYVETQPYSTLHQPTRPVLVEVPEPEPVSAPEPVAQQASEEPSDCREFAASSADSMDPSGRVIRICNDGVIRVYQKTPPRPRRTTVQVVNKVPEPRYIVIQKQEPQCCSNTTIDLRVIVGQERPYIKATDFGGSNEHLLIAVVGNNYQILCELLGRKGKQRTFNGTCYLAGDDGQVQASYTGPVKQGKGPCRIDCMTVKDQIKDKRSCAQWKRINQYEKDNGYQQRYDNLAGRVMHSLRGR